VASFSIFCHNSDAGSYRFSRFAQTDARGCVTNIAYDELNRPTGKTYAGCPTTGAVTYTYDAGMNGKGRRTSMTDASGSTSWLYDSRGRVTKETKVIASVSFVTEWTYNLADLPETMKYPDGEIGSAAVKRGQFAHC